MTKKTGIEIKLASNETEFTAKYSPEAFKGRLVYYLTPKQNRDTILKTFVLLDFKNGKRKYLNAHLDSNTKILENCPGRFVCMKMNEPHAAVTLNEDKDFYAFMFKNANYLYHIDYKNNVARLICAKDLKIGEIKRIGDTFVRDEEQIYISGAELKTNGCLTKLYKSDIDLTKLNKIGEYNFKLPVAPHSSFFYKGLIINGYLEGSHLVVYNINYDEVTYYPISSSSPAHIEASGDYIYVSNHNLTRIKGEVAFTDTGYIDKFLVTDKGLEHKATFQDPRGFRFTSHKILNYGGKEYIVTMGEPNRLFIIDAEDMTLHHYDTIGKEVIPENEDPMTFLNANVSKLPDSIKPVEVSQNGEYIILISYHNIMVYSFPEKKIVQVLKTIEDIDENLNPREYELATAHTNFI